MDLREYLFREKITETALAQKINYTRTSVCLVANKKRKPGKKLAKAIEAATNGKVTVNELLSSYQEKND